MSFENVRLMKCGSVKFVAVLLLFVVVMLPPICVSQQATHKSPAIDPPAIVPNPPSIKSVEDLTHASLEGSHLFADAPVVLEKAEKKTFTREFVAVQWRP